MCVNIQSHLEIIEKIVITDKNQHLQDSFDEQDTFHFLFLPAFFHSPSPLTFDP